MFDKRCKKIPTASSVCSGLGSQHWLCLHPWDPPALPSAPPSASLLLLRAPCALGRRAVGQELAAAEKSPCKRSERQAKPCGTVRAGCWCCPNVPQHRGARRSEHCCLPPPYRDIRQRESQDITQTSRKGGRRRARSPER